MKKQVYIAAALLAVASLPLHAQTKRKTQPNTKPVATRSTIKTETKADNTLSPAEEQEGWVLLFDGKTTDGWRGVYKDEFPRGLWKVEDGMLVHHSAEGAESAAGGDIITKDQYSNFELELDFNIAPGGNSGIKYFVVERQPRPKGSAIGLEYQILDDEKHPDAKMGRDGNRTIASLYDMITASAEKKPNPPGEWNHARIVVQKGRVEHWLNGVKVVEYDRFSPEFQKLRSISKYAPIEDFGQAEAGHILLQDHGDLVKFKNIKIRKL